MDGNAPVTHKGGRAARSKAAARRLARSRAQHQPLPPSLNLHLGCGSIHLNGYVNIDIEKWCNAVDVVADACDLSRYETGTVTHIYAHALLEHIAPWDTMRALKEWYRVLKPDGTIQVEVPDLERIFDGWFVSHAITEKTALDYIFGGVSPDKRYKNQHHLTGFTYKRLVRMMKAAGFIDCERVEHPKIHLILGISAKKVAK